MDTGAKTIDPTDSTTGGDVSAPAKTEDVRRVLCGILLEGIDIHRVQAAQALGKIGDVEAVDTLIKALLDEDEDVRTDAATALATIGDTKANKQLLENLIGDPCAEVKMSAMKALSQSRDPEVSPWLHKILAGRSEEIAWDEEEFFNSGWDDWADMQVRAIESLADLGDETAVEGIVEALNDDDALDIVKLSMNALGRIGPSGIQALIRYLDSDDLLRRRRAAAALASCESPDATKGVIKAIQDPSIDVRLAVLHALAEKNPADVRMEALLLDKASQVRAEAVKLGGAHHEDRLDLLLDDKSLDVQLAILELLSENPQLTKTPMLTGRLRDMLSSETPEVVAAAAAAYGAIAGEKASAELGDLLNGENVSEDLQRGAIRGLRAAGGEEALQALITVLSCDIRQVRIEAMSAISDLASRSLWPNAAGDALLAALAGELVPAPEEPEEEETEAEAETEEPEAEALEEVEEDVVEEEVAEEDNFPASTLDAITNTGQVAQQVTQQTDVELTPEDMELLSLAQGSKKGRKRVPLVPDVVIHEDVQLFATRLLGNFPEASVSEALLAPLAQADMEMKQAAADSLAHIAADISDLPQEVEQALQGEVSCTDRDIRRQAIRALGCSKDPSVVMVLINALDDEDSFVRTEAVRSLGRLGEAGVGVGRLLQDPDATVRLTAAEALVETKPEGVVETLIDFAFSNEGYHIREAARLLVDVDKEAANGLLLDVLNDEERKRYWKVAIEALEELNRS